MNRKYWVYVGALALVTVFITMLAKRVYLEEARRKRNEAGYSTFALMPDPRRKAPEFTLKDLNGNLVSLADLRGKAVMINFRTTW